MNIKLTLVVLVATVLTCTGYSQERVLDSLLTAGDYMAFNQTLNTSAIIKKNSSEFNYYKGKYYLNRRELDSALNFLSSVDTLSLSKTYLSYFWYSYGDILRYSNNEEKAFKIKLKAKDLFLNSGNQKWANKVNYDLHYTLISQEFLNYDGQFYLQMFYKKAKDLNDYNQLFSAHLALSMLKIDPKLINTTIFHLDKAKKYAKQLGTFSAFYKYYNYKTIFHQNFTQNYEDALKCADSAYYFAIVLKSSNKIESSLKNLAYTHTLQENYSKAIKLLKKADSLPITEHVLNRKRSLYQYLAKNHEKLGLIDDAYYYLKKKNVYDNEISIASKNTSLILFRTQEIEKKNLILDKKRIANKNLLIISMILLSLVCLIAFVIISNLNKKKLLAEKDKELKEARIEKLIQEQEVKNIDALYEGREKERKRIASDLHDDLGSILSTMMLYFQNMKIRKDRFQKEEEHLIQKTKDLLDEAYKKVRSIAHLEDAASSISEGLVDAITNFGYKVSSSENLLVQVYNNGLDKQLTSSVEQDLRRIIIELITNVMKHAKATEVNIEFTCTKRELNIVVEDNGVGFKVSKNDFSQGMGIYNAKKKIEAMKGKMIIESVGNNGSSIIIDIPIL